MPRKFEFAAVRDVAPEAAHILFTNELIIAC
jgi:hypothetical protein